MCVCATVNVCVHMQTHVCVCEHTGWFGYTFLCACLCGWVGVRTGVCSCLYVPYFLKYKSGRLFISTSLEVVIFLRQAFI